MEQQMPAPAKAIVTPLVDLMCCGGLSILVIVGLLAYAEIFGAPAWMLDKEVNLQRFLLLHVLINFPHFMASYRLLYRSKEQIVRYRWASVYIPLILAALVFYALRFPSIDEMGQSDVANGWVIQLMLQASMLLLAWHYTGQGWGMTASFSYIAGIRMDGLERLLIRSGYRALLVWHVLWVLLYLPELDAFNLWIPEFRQHYFLSFYRWWGVAVALSAVLGTIGFVRVRVRTQKQPPLRAVVPWVATYTWYVLILFYPNAFPILQISHALQYIIFPLRVEANQYDEQHQAVAGRGCLHAAAYYVILVLAGLAVFKGPELAWLFGDKSFEIRDLIAYSVNLHHYFTDGVIWKISNPRVRKDLFAHLN